MLSVLPPSLQPLPLFDEATRIDFVRAYCTSGLSQKDFCAQHGLKKSTFKNWFYRHREMFVNEAGTKNCDDSAPSSSPPLFSPVNIISDPLEPIDQAGALSPSLRIDIHDFQLFVPIGADVQTLHTVLSLLKKVS